MEVGKAFFEYIELLFVPPTERRRNGGFYEKITVRRIDETHAEDARLPKQPFQIWRCMIPCLKYGKIILPRVCQVKCVNYFFGGHMTAIFIA